MIYPDLLQAVFECGLPSETRSKLHLVDLAGRCVCVCVCVYAGRCVCVCVLVWDQVLLWESR